MGRAEQAVEMHGKGCNCAQAVLTVFAPELGLAQAEGVEQQTIVLTGAMIPYAFGSSDGMFNLGSALSFAQTLPPGVYVAMNGRHFRWDQVRKNRQTGVFEPVG